MKIVKLCKLILFSLLLLAWTPSINAETFLFESPNDKLEIGESFSDVLQALSLSELTLLKSLKITTDEGTTDSNQFIRFGGSSTALQPPQISYTKSEENNIAPFIFLDAGSSSTSAFFEYDLEFEEGLKSKISSNSLEDFYSLKLNIFADEYIIVDTDIDTSSKRIELKLASGAISDYINEGEKKIYTIGSKKYEVEIVMVESNTKKVKLKINGQDIGDLEKGEFTEFQPGVSVGIIKVLTTSSASPDIVELFLGAKIIELIDEDYTDASFRQGLKINQKSINEGYTQIIASVSGDIFSIANIRYRLKVSTKTYVGEGEKLSEKLNNPESLLGNWDIRFEGLETVQETPVIIDSVGTTEYKLDFTNIDGKSFSVPFITDSPSFKLGDSNQDLIIVEGSSSTQFNIDKDDYFILSTGVTKTDHTYVLKYDDISTSTQTLFFTDLSGGSQSIQYTINNTDSGVLGDATLSVGSISSKVVIQNSSTNSINIDQNGDGSFGASAVDIITQGGAIIDLGTTNSISSKYSLSVTTDASDLEESTTDESVTFKIAGGGLAIDSDDFTGAIFSTESNQRFAMTNYGTTYQIDNTDSSVPEELTISYPHQQKFVKAYIEIFQSSQQATSIEEISTDICSNSLMDGDETGIDCGGSCPPCEQQKKTIENQTLLQCPFGCLHTTKEETIICLKVGNVVEDFFCSEEKILKLTKANQKTCKENYECKAEVCSDSKCGKKTSSMSIIFNIMLILLIIFIIYYATTLIAH